MNRLKIKKLTVILTFVACILMCCFIITGCAEDDKYHAELDSYAHYIMNEDFRKEHKVNAKGYNSVYLDENAPESYTFIISDEEQFKNIFIHFQGDIDFNSKTVILYIACNEYARPYELLDLSIEDQTAKIKFAMQYDPYLKDWCGSYQRCFMLTLDKVDIISAEFIDMSL